MARFLRALIIGIQDNGFISNCIVRHHIRCKTNLLKYFYKCAVGEGEDWAVGVEGECCLGGLVWLDSGREGGVHWSGADDIATGSGSFS